MEMNIYPVTGSQLIHRSKQPPLCIRAHGIAAFQNLAWPQIMQLPDQPRDGLPDGFNLFLFQPDQSLMKLFKLLLLPVPAVQPEGGQMLLAAVERLFPEPQLPVRLLQGKPLPDSGQQAMPGCYLMPEICSQLYGASITILMASVLGPLPDLLKF